VPLKSDSSNKSRQTNFLTEVAAGKPKKQALAISYAVQRKAVGKKPKPKRT